MNNYKLLASVTTKEYRILSQMCRRISPLRWMPNSSIVNGIPMEISFLDDEGALVRDELRELVLHEHTKVLYFYIDYLNTDKEVVRTLQLHNANILEVVGSSLDATSMEPCELILKMTYSGTKNV